MGCYSKLVESKFIEAASSELQQAQLALGNTPSIPPNRSYGLPTRLKRLVYSKYVSTFDLLSYPAKVTDEWYNDLHYLRVDHILFAFSGKKKSIDTACNHSYNVNGDIPYYRTSHTIGGRVFYTVLIDTRFSLVPSSPN